jgi:hypothetical protein
MIRGSGDGLVRKMSAEWLFQCARLFLCVPQTNAKAEQVSVDSAGNSFELVAAVDGTVP